MDSAEAPLRRFPDWTGRVDGPEASHARWHSVMREWEGLRDARSAPRSSRSGTPAVVLIGFASDEGVRRNQGRIGAAGGPIALRQALASLSDPGVALFDAGDVVVDSDLETGQARLGSVVETVLAAGGLPVVLGGGHEVAYGSYLGWAARLGPGDRGEQWGILNLDAHFDLREESRSTSGTPFRQIAHAERAAGRSLVYAVAGISRASNTRALFDTAATLGATWVLDDAADSGSLVLFVGEWLEGVDRVHLSIDLDVLPASVAPGVSAPNGFGVAVDAVRAAVRTVAASGKLGLLEVAELNPAFDPDGRTARTAARLVDEAIRACR